LEPPYITNKNAKRGWIRPANPRLTDVLDADAFPRMKRLTLSGFDARTGDFSRTSFDQLTHLTLLACENAAVSAAAADQVKQRIPALELKVA
jgi:hypothetical protein